MFLSLVYENQSDLLGSFPLQTAPCGILHTSSLNKPKSPFQKAMFLSLLLAFLNVLSLLKSNILWSLTPKSSHLSSHLQLVLTLFKKSGSQLLSCSNAITGNLVTAMGCAVKATIVRPIHGGKVKQGFQSSLDSGLSFLALSQLLKSHLS